MMKHKTLSLHICLASANTHIATMTTILGHLNPSGDIGYYYAWMAKFAARSSISYRNVCKFFGDHQQARAQLAHKTIVKVCDTFFVCLRPTN